MRCKRYTIYSCTRYRDLGSIAARECPGARKRRQTARRNVITLQFSATEDRRFKKKKNQSRTVVNTPKIITKYNMIGGGVLKIIKFFSDDVCATNYKTEIPCLQLCVRIFTIGFDTKNRHQVKKKTISI